MIIAGTQMDAVLGCLPLFVRENVKDWLLVNEVCQDEFFLKSK
jgi:hypothetical protein